MSAAGSIFGGLAASEAMKKYKSQVEARKRENRNWYDRRYNEDVTQRADAQRLLTLTEEQIRRRNKAAAGTAAVMGTSPEAVAAEKAGNSSVLADTVAQINAGGEGRKEAVESSYRDRDAQLQGRLDQLEVNRAGEISGATKGVLGAAGNVAGLMDEYFEKRSSDEKRGKGITGLS